ncbi:MAG: ATP phosphoribosyltransferase [Euryhalocaulis sp.]|uniref:ATP phosphoribosyltransferase n=1 Tax=Euryhalocaulis sp. TaxID=2744307 RepID=UPI0017FB589C|nr:ATP phosphoribosyltransferase [Euryhalocaulis sp.]MBA4801990.1 ATP phosphoribosyltransferase [Euryhalocaulis sp.]
MTERRLRIAIQKKGRLADASLKLLKDAGYRAVQGKNELLYRVENAPIDLMRVRDDDIPGFLEDGVCELGVIGENVLAEAFAGNGEHERPEIIQKLGFGKCRLMIAMPEAARYDGPASLEGMRIATSYPGLLGEFLRRNGVKATPILMHGAVEVAPRLKMAQAICDLVSTGSTLEANNLKAVELVFESQAVLARTRAGIDPAVRNVADSVIARIEGVVATQGTKYILMNAPRAALDEIAEILPGANSPTVLPLAGKEDKVAVHAVCRESVFWETLEKLKAAGASAILVLPIEKMMM